MLHGMLWAHLAEDTIILSALSLITNFVFDFKNLQFPMSDRGTAYKLLHKFKHNLVKALQVQI